jgi:putative transposase
MGAHPVAASQAAERGRKVSVDLREMLNAIRYMARSGGGWRMPFQPIHDVSLMVGREPAGREARPSAGVIDRQTVKAPHSKARGYDANKKIVGRKRHIAVDTDGRLLMGNLTTTT